MGIGNIIRPEGIVFLVSILGFELFHVYQRNKKIIVKEIVVIFVIYFCVIQAASFLVSITEINKYGLKNNSANMKFVLGLNLKSNGMWNQEDMHYLGDEEKQKEIIAERIKELNIKNSIPFFETKLKETLGPGTLWWTFDYLKDNETILKKDKYWWINEFGEYNKTFFYIVFAFMVLGIISLRNKMISKNMLLLNIIAITIGVYMLIEVQTRYAYIPQIAIFVVSAIGYDCFLKKVYVETDNKGKRITSGKESD